MRIVLLNPNTTEAVTTLMADAGRAAAGHGVEVKAVTASRGLPSITNRAEAHISGAVGLEMLADMREASTPPVRGLRPRVHGSAPVHPLVVGELPGDRPAVSRWLLA